MNNPNQQEILQRMTRWYLDRGRVLYPNHKIRPVDVAFDLTGRAAGTYNPARLLIRYNMQLAENQFDEFVAQTVPHEVAHHVVDEVTRLWLRRVRPHGDEWRLVMRHFGQEPDRCHDFDLQGVKIKRQRRFLYRCACQEHAVSTVRHNRARKGTRYRCTKCDQALVYQQQVSSSEPSAQLE